VVIASEAKQSYEIASSLRSLAQTGIIDETTSCLEPVAPGRASQ
jgi:hypothetical protein